MSDTSSLSLRTHWRSLALFVAAVTVTQLIGGLVTFPEIPTWYAHLNKPAWTPPNWLFGPVWTTLYILIALAGWIVWNELPGEPKNKWRRPVMIFYVIQLVLNFLWSPLFFLGHFKMLALGVLTALVICVAVTIRYAYAVDRRAAYLLAPYLLWVAYASTLNAGIVYLN